MLDWTRPLELHEIVDRGVALFRAQLPRVLPLALCVGIGSEAAAQLAFASEETRLGVLVKAGDWQGLVDDFAPRFLALSVLGLWLTSALLGAIGLAARGRPGGTADALLGALRAMPRLVVANVVAIAFALAGLGVVGALVAVIGRETIGPVAPFLFGMAIAQALWALVATSLQNQAVLFDRHDGVRAVTESLRLTRDHWWRVLGLYLLVGVAALLVLILLALPVNLVAAAFGAVGGEAARTAALVLGSGAAAGVVSAAVQAVLVCLYHDLALRAGAAPSRDPGALDA